MSEQPPMPPTTHDFPDHWGFYLLQAIHRLDDKIESVRRDVNQRIDSLDAKIEAVQRDVNQRIDSLDAKIEAVQHGVNQRIDQVQRDVTQRFDTVDQKITPLQYWYWGTLVVIIMGFVTVFLTRS